MTGTVAIAVVLFMLDGGTSWIRAIFSPSYRRRRRDSRARHAESMWGIIAVLSGVVLLVAAGLHHVGLIDLEDF